MTDTPDCHLIRGNRLTPIARTLKQGGAAVDLTPIGTTVEFKMVQEDGTVVQDWTQATIVDAATGKVHYALSAANWSAMVDGSRFYYWFRVVRGGLFDAFPRDGRAAVLMVYEAT